MDVIQQCFEEHQVALTAKLVNVNYTIEQAKHFLPFAATSISDSSQENSVFQTIAGLTSDSLPVLVKTVDMHSLVKASGLDSIKVASGLYAIAPVIMQALALKCRRAA